MRGHLRDREGRGGEEINDEKRKRGGTRVRASSAAAATAAVPIGVLLFSRCLQCVRWPLLFTDGHLQTFQFGKRIRNLGKRVTQFGTKPQRPKSTIQQQRTQTH